MSDVLRDRLSGRVYMSEDIVAMRAILAHETGLDLRSMSDKSVVANYCARHPGEVMRPISHKCDDCPTPANCGSQGCPREVR